MGPIWGGIKLDAKMYGNFEGFPLNSALFGLVIHHPCFGILSCTKLWKRIHFIRMSILSKHFFQAVNM